MCLAAKEKGGQEMQPGDLVPTFTGLAWLADQIQDFDSNTLNGLYTVLVFYEVRPGSPLIIPHFFLTLIISSFIQ